MRMRRRVIAAKTLIGILENRGGRVSRRRAAVPKRGAALPK